MIRRTFLASLFALAAGLLPRRPTPPPPRCQLKVREEFFPRCQHIVVCEFDSLDAFRAAFPRGTTPNLRPPPPGYRRGLTEWETIPLADGRVRFWWRAEDQQIKGA